MLIKLFLIRFFDMIYPAWSVRIAADLFATPRRIPRPPFENELIKRGRRVVFECGLVAYKFGEGAPVLLIHGWEGRGTQLGHFVDPLVEKGFAVYAVDGPGHGESPGRSITPTLFATFLKSIEIEIGPLHALIGHSFGAASSVLAAYNGLGAKKLVLVAGPDRYSRVVDHYCQQIKISSHTRELFYREVVRRVGMHPNQMQTSVLAKHIGAEILLVHDRGDRAVAYESSLRIHESIPGSQLLSTEGLGHRRILKDPEVIRRSVEFVASR